jgi:heparosan-N-sulfate-glucuronate 5-epimerase
MGNLEISETSVDSEGQSRRDRAGFLSSAKSFSLPVGPHLQPGQIRGYYIDMRVKARGPEWPPASMVGEDLYVDIAQWALGAYERYLAGDGEVWLNGALAAGEALLSQQHRGGPLDGAFMHRVPYPHTFPVGAPWISAMAQGEAASLLTRLYLETERESFADGAIRALGPIGVPQPQGGAQGLLGGEPFPEEYPTDPSSFVLNGAMFALWGYYDVGSALRDSGVLETWGARTATLADNLHRWDAGYWSRYDLYPHVVTNIASSFYHALHIAQLEAMAALVPRPEIAIIRRRFVAHAESRVCQTHAFVRKAMFRLAVPRNGVMARRLPWIKRPPR